MDPANEPANAQVTKPEFAKYDANSAPLDVLLDKLTELDAAASAAPWYQCGASRGGCQCGLVWTDDGIHLACQASAGHPDDLESMESALPTKDRIANASLVAALRNTCKRLVGLGREVIRLRKKCANQTRELRRLNRDRYLESQSVHRYRERIGVLEAQIQMFVEAAK